MWGCAGQLLQYNAVRLWTASSKAEVLWAQRQSVRALTAQAEFIQDADAGASAPKARRAAASKDLADEDGPGQYVPALSSPMTIVHQTGRDLLANSWINKGTAFPSIERDRLGLRGLLPPRPISMEMQVGDLAGRHAITDRTSAVEWRMQGCFSGHMRYATLCVR